MAVHLFIKKFAEIKNNVIDVSNSKNSIIIEKLDVIWRFTIAISIEFKKDTITYKMFPYELKG